MLITSELPQSSWFVDLMMYRDVLVRFEATLKEMEETKIQLDNLKGNLNGAVERMEARLNKWVDCVTKVADQLNTYFDSFMSALQYKGGVNATCFIVEINGI